MENFLLCCFLFLWNCWTTEIYFLFLMQSVWLVELIACHHPPVRQFRAQSQGRMFPKMQCVCRQVTWLCSQQWLVLFIEAGGGRGGGCCDVITSFPAVILYSNKTRWHHHCICDITVPQLEGVTFTPLHELTALVTLLKLHSKQSVQADVWIFILF